MRNTKFIAWNLKDIVNEIHKHHQEISKIYLFGSRAYKTNSFRSDIDILGVTNHIAIPVAEINSWLHDKFPPVDLFCTYDFQVAESVVNGSRISYNQDNKRGYKDLAEQLDAKLLWDENIGFATDFSDWTQQTLNGINYSMSIIPSYPIANFEETLNHALASLEASGIKTFYAGSTVVDISKTIIKIIEIGLTKPPKFQNKAKKFSFKNIEIGSEYDFQNIIHFLIRPIFPDITPEPFQVTIDGNKKIADFGICGNKIVIEAKWIDSISKKDTVVKTIKGLSDFYIQNPNISSLIFLILYDRQHVTIDKVALETIFSYEKSAPPIFVRFLESEYIKS